MKEILIFAGTTEGRKLSEHLAEKGILHTLCVATEYGEIVLNAHPVAKIHKGRMNQAEMKAFMIDGKFAAVVDATHPYASVVTENIRLAMEGMDIPYFRLKREIEAVENYEKLITFENNAACAKALEAVEGNILLTTGSKELAEYCVSEAVKSRLYVRVLPGLESISICMEQGIYGKQIIALQGPFSTELNEAILKQYQICCLVTKKSGKAGGYQEKIKAARNLGIPVYVVGNPGKEEGDSFEEVCKKLENICGNVIPEAVCENTMLHSQSRELEILLAGVGMGSKDALTQEVSKAIEGADILLGAERMIQSYCPKLEKQPFYQASQIIPYLRDIQKNTVFPAKAKVVILFSGDSGFYSGCQVLYRALNEEIKSGQLKASLGILPGISSVSYLASCIGESYQDAAIYSIHGKELPNLVRRIEREQKTFLLLSGVKDVNRLGALLQEAGMCDCEITAGCQLSYPNQQIRRLTPKECIELTKEGLYTCFIKNSKAKAALLTHGRTDAEFIREKVPMTKEEVREVSICKLRLHKNAVVYDIGSGTGSIAVEMAGLSDDMQVYAIERNCEAVALIEKNKEKFHLENIKVVRAEAPEGLSDLPVPTHAFIGGSGGKLREILSALYQRNPKLRVVLNAITMETICEMKEVLAEFPMDKEEIVQMQVSRTKKAGSYHLMQAENPVWILSFTFCENV